VFSMDDIPYTFCIVCGDPIPEGHTICPLCEYEAELQAEREKTEREKGEEKECTTDNE